MAKYKGSVELISGITQANGQTFPLVDASAVQTDANDKRLDKSLEEIKKNFNTVNASIDEVNSISVSPTQPSKDNVEMWVNPSTTEEFSIPEVNDAVVNSSDTWSSEKINAEIEKAKTSSSADREAITEMKDSIDNSYRNVSVMRESIESTNNAVQTTYESFLTKSSEATESITTGKSDAVTAIQNAGKTQTDSITSTGSAQKTAVEKAGTDATSAINTAKTTAIGSVTSEGTKQTKSVTDAGTAAVSNITSAKNTGVQAITDEGTKQTNAVNSAASTAKTEISTAQTNAVNSVSAEGKKQLSSITTAATEISKINGVEIGSSQPTNAKTAVWINPNAKETINVVEINDSVTSTIDTWSSQKIYTELQSLLAKITALETQTQTVSDEDAATYLGGN